MGGGDRRRGETGHLGESRRCSAWVGDLRGTGALMPGSLERGGSDGVVADERVLEAEDKGAGGGLDLAGLGGL